MKKDFLTLSLCAAMGLLAACSKPSFGLPQTSDNFSSSVAYNNKVDILWIVDDSKSMLQHQQRLSTQIPVLVNNLNSLKMDYHMAVVTTSMYGLTNTGGKFVGTPKYVTKATPNLVNVLAERMIVGQAGNDNERGLDSMMTALSPTYINGEGAGFLREDALLVIVALSDEDDKSAPSVSTFTSFLDKLKTPWIDGSRSWMFNFIGVLEDSSACRTFNDYSQPGDVYMEMVKKTKGVQESICSSNLGVAVTNIRARIVQILTDFKLKSINGVIIPRSSTNGWDYIAATNSVRFYGSAVPAADVSISVDFKPAEAN
jgi:hypothetical protein